MAINFPNAPFFGQIYPAAPGEIPYQWDGEKWISGVVFYTGSAIDFPSSPAFGQGFLGYIWDGEKWAWTAVVAPGGGNVIFSVAGNATLIILEDF